MSVYFGLYAAFGPKGLDVLTEREQELALAKAELEILTEEHAALERRVRLLDGRTIDRDLLEEEVRLVLNRAHPDEVIVLLPPPVRISSEPLPLSPSEPASDQQTAQ